MRISAEEKRNLLIQRGFTAEEIDSGFRSFIDGSSDKRDIWDIQTITPERLAETCDLYDIAKLFQMDSIFNRWGGSTHYNDIEWYSRREDDEEFQVSAAILEPFVARLVKAVNKSCIFTTMSCDGWHKFTEDYEMEHGPYRELILGMYDRYSTLWFWVIAEIVFGEKWPVCNPYYDDLENAKGWEGIFEPDIAYNLNWQRHAERYMPGFSAKSKLIYRIVRGTEAEAYRKINFYACFLEKYRDELCEIRKKWIAALLEKWSNNEIYSLRFLVVHEFIIDAVRNDLERMHAKWIAAEKELLEMTGSGRQAWDFCRW